MNRRLQRRASDRILYLALDYAIEKREKHIRDLEALLYRAEDMLLNPNEIDNDLRKALIFDIHRTVK